jgi:hypothetical protein
MRRSKSQSFYLVKLSKVHLASKMESGKSKIGGLMEFSAFNFLVLVSFGLLVVVTGGVLYLTALDWRDRRREQEAKRKR